MSTPIATLAISSSRSAIQARPMREFFRRVVTTMVSATSASTM